MGASQEFGQHAGRAVGRRRGFAPASLEKALGAALVCVPAVGADRAFAWLRIALAALLLFAAAQKSYDVLAPGSVARASQTTIAVVLGETAAAALLLLCRAPLAWRLGLLVFTMFAVVAAYKWLIGSASCGCFGRLSLHPAVSLAIDLAALAALVLLRPGPSMRDSARARLWVGAAVAWLALAAFLTVAFANRAALAEGVHVTASGHVVLEPGNWIGKELPILPYIQSSTADLARGDWTLMLFRPGCAHCEDALARWSRSSTHRRRLIIQTSRGDGPAGAARLADDKTSIRRCSSI